MQLAESGISLSTFPKKLAKKLSGIQFSLELRKSYASNVKEINTGLYSGQ